MFKIHFYVILKNISYLTFRIDWLNWRLPLWTTFVELELIYARFLDWLSHIICVFLGNCAKNNSYSENAMIIQKERKKERFFLWGKRLLLSCNVPYHKSSVSCCCFFQKFHFSSVTKMRLSLHKCMQLSPLKIFPSS